MQARVEGVVQLRVSFSGECLPNCYLKIRTSTDTKVFQGKNDPNSPDFEGKINQITRLV
jgi:hypothetical protein